MRIALTRIRALCAIPLVVTALTVGSACSEPSTGPVPTPSSTVSPPTPTPAPTPTPTARPTADAKTEAARREVLALVDKYYKVDQRIAKNRRVPLDRYYTVAAGKYVQVLLQNAQSQRAQGHRVIGSVRFGRPDVLKLDPSGDKDKLPSATVQICLDVSRVDVVDQEGKSVVKPNRADAYVERLRIQKKKNGWRVVAGTNKGTARCGA